MTAILNGNVKKVITFPDSKKSHELIGRILSQNDAIIKQNELLLRSICMFPLVIESEQGPNAYIPERSHK